MRTSSPSQAARSASRRCSASGLRAPGGSRSSRVAMWPPRITRDTSHLESPHHLTRSRVRSITRLGAMYSASPDSESEETARFCDSGADGRDLAVELFFVSLPEDFADLRPGRL